MVNIVAVVDIKTPSYLRSLVNNYCVYMSLLTLWAVATTKQCLIGRLLVRYRCFQLLDMTSIYCSWGAGLCVIRPFSSYKFHLSGIGSFGSLIYLPT